MKTMEHSKPEENINLNSQTRNLILNVKGMHCASCEILIERSLSKVAGVQKVYVNRANAKAHVECEESVSLADLQAAVTEKGYTLSLEENIEKEMKKAEHSKKHFFEVGFFFIIIIALYFLLRRFDIIPSFDLSDDMSYGLVFVIGLIAATSTCLAVSGGLLLAIANKFNERHPELNGWQKFRPHIFFNLGRIISYALLGGLIGFIGSAIAISPMTTGIITLLASILMIIIGLQLMHVFSFLDHIKIRMPKFIAHRIYEKGHQEDHKVNSATAFAFGASTFFLPCGFTQALQLYVLGKGDPMGGAITMLVFSLGTLPSLAGIGAFVSFAKGSFQKHLMTFSAVLVLLLGLFTLPAGLALMGISVPWADSIFHFGFFNDNNGNKLLDESQIIDGKQIVTMRIVGLEYEPSNFVVKQGIPVEWRIDSSEAEGCAQVLSAPELGISELLPKDSIKIITFMPNEIGKIPFSCAMGMTTQGASFEVVPN